MLIQMFWKLGAQRPLRLALICGYWYCDELCVLRDSLRSCHDYFPFDLRCAWNRIQRGETSEVRLYYKFWESPEDLGLGIALPFTVMPIPAVRASGDVTRHHLCLSRGMPYAFDLLFSLGPFSKHRHYLLLDFFPPTPSAGLSSQYLEKLAYRHLYDQQGIAETSREIHQA